MDSKPPDANLQTCTVVGLKKKLNVVTLHDT